MYCIEYFKHPLLESCWDGYIPGEEHLFNQVSNEKQTEKTKNTIQNS